MCQQKDVLDDTELTTYSDCWEAIEIHTYEQYLRKIKEFSLYKKKKKTRNFYSCLEHTDRIVKR